MLLPGDLWREGQPLTQAGYSHSGLGTAACSTVKRRRRVQSKHWSLGSSNIPWFTVLYAQCSRCGYGARARLSSLGMSNAA